MVLTCVAVKFWINTTLVILEMANFTQQLSPFPIQCLQTATHAITNTNSTISLSQEYSRGIYDIRAVNLNIFLFSLMSFEGMLMKMEGIVT